MHARWLAGCCSYSPAGTHIGFEQARLFGAEGCDSELMGSRAWLAVTSGIA
jgi:hypothetical protein